MMTDEKLSDDRLCQLRFAYSAIPAAIGATTVEIINDLLAARGEVRAIRAEAALAEREPTDAMLNAARDWSQKKYGMGIGNDAATGCWKAMFDARARTATQAEGMPEMDEVRQAQWDRRQERYDRATSPQPPASPSQEGGMREALYRLIDALLRLDSEQDGNWGWPSFDQELHDIRAALARDAKKENS